MNSGYPTQGEHSKFSFGLCYIIFFSSLFRTRKLRKYHNRSRYCWSRSISIHCVFSLLDSLAFRSQRHQQWLHYINSAPRCWNYPVAWMRCHRWLHRPVPSIRITEPPKQWCSKCRCCQAGIYSRGGCQGNAIGTSRFIPNNFLQLLFSLWHFSTVIIAVYVFDVFNVACCSSFERKASTLKSFMVRLILTMARFICWIEQFFWWA